MGKMITVGGKYVAKVVTDFGIVPKREDLIQRGALMDAYDAEHKGPPGRARELMAFAPAVDAIPVEWLKKLAERKAGNSNMWIMQGFLSRSVEAILQLWKDEHNAT